MRLGEWIRTAVGLVRRHPFLWFLGGLGAVANEGLGTLLRLTVSDQLPAGELAALQTAVNQTLANPRPLITFLLLLILGLLVVWLITATAEGGLISAAAHSLRGTPLDLRTSLRRGVQLLKPFILIDTLLFFPLFVLLLGILLLIFGAIIWAALRTGDSAASTVLSILTWGIGCSLPLAALLLPVGALTYLLRVLALRQTAVEHPGWPGVRSQIRRAGHLLRSHAGQALLLGGLVLLLALGQRLLLWPLALLPAGVWAEGLRLLITLLLASLTHTFISCLWTVWFVHLARID